MKKSLALVSLAGLLATPLTHADMILGVYAGGGKWNTDLSGDISESDTPNVDFKDLGLDDQDNNFYYVALEHPIPVLPNVRIQVNDITMSETGQLTREFNLGGNTLAVNTEVTSDFDLSHNDYTLYYEVLDNWLNLDFGITARQFDGYVEVSERLNPTNQVSEEIDETLPLLYLKGQVDLPFTGFYVAASGNAISYDGSDVTDFQAGVGYLSDGWVLDLGMELGFRQFNVTLDDVSDIDADMELGGAYFSLNAHF